MESESNFTYPSKSNPKEKPFIIPHSNTCLNFNRIKCTLYGTVAIIPYRITIKSLIQETI